MHIGSHPNCPAGLEQAIRKRLYWDHGTGVLYWKRRYRGDVVLIDRALVEEGHCTSINKKDYKLALGSKRNKYLPVELDDNFELREIARRLDLLDLVVEP